VPIVLLILYVVATAKIPAWAITSLLVFVGVGAALFTFAFASARRHHTATIADGKFYSYYMCGFYNTTAKTSDAFVLEDTYPVEIDWSVALVRFVHTIPNASPLTLYATNTLTHDTLPVGGAVAYKSGGAFTALPPGVYDLFARYTDSTTNKVTRTGVSLFPGRVYTVGARGDITITSTTATNRPFLDNTTNR